jgi:predicted PurR-regulated permease PerM
MAEAPRERAAWWRARTGAPATRGAGEPEQRPSPERVALRVALVVDGVVLATVVGVFLLWRLRVVILLVVVATFFAVLLHPAVSFLDRRGLRRGLSTTIVFLGALVCLLALGFLLFHPVYASATRFARDLPGIVRQAQHGEGQIGHLVRRLHLLSYVQTHAPRLETLISSLGRPALEVGRTVVGGVAAAATIAVLCFFILLEAPAMFRGVLGWMRPERAARTRRIADEVARTVTGYMLGNLATSVIAGLVVYVALVLTGVPFSLVLALWVALVDFLPLVGGLLAGVPTVAIAFLHSATAGFVALLVFLAYQQVENHLLNPVVLSRTVRLNPLFVLLAVLVGAELGGIVGSTLGGLMGALLAVPAAGAVQVVVREAWSSRARAETLAGATGDGGRRGPAPGGGPGAGGAVG